MNPPFPLRAITAVVTTLSVGTSCAPLPPAAAPPPPALRSVIRAADGTVLAYRFQEDRTPVHAEDIPRVVRDALIAAEDQRFFEHEGVDAPALVRAAVATFRSGSVQGGSTITQQLAKMAYHDGGARTLDRKFTEAVLAMELEQRYDKHELLAMYLNRAYFGAGAYGIAAAAERILGKNLERLTLADAALLVGLVRAPTSLDPFANPDGARERRSYVIGRMLEEGMIDRRAAMRALRAPLRLRARPAHRMRAPAFVTWVEELLLADPALGDSPTERAASLLRGGLQITTTLDARMQRAAERAVAGVLNRPGDPDVALVALDPRTGAVKAMVGGRDSRFGDLNLAVHARRQPGSTFKPFVLAAAMERGISPEARYASDAVTVRWGPTRRERWRVRNYDGLDRGRISLTEGLRYSVNGVYARVAAEVGPEAVIDVAQRLGITAEMDPYPSVALGALPVGISPLELASAYGALAAHGRLAPPTAILRVSDASGRTLLEPTRQPPLPALDPGVAFFVTRALEDVMRRGTGAGAWIGRPAAGKTGTTDDHVDAWFVGFTPQLVTAVWVGHAEGARPMRRVRGGPVTGSRFPAQIWRHFMLEALDGTPPRAFQPPVHGLIEVRVGPSGDCLASEEGRLVSLPAALLPSRTCPIEQRADPTATPLAPSTVP